MAVQHCKHVVLVYCGDGVELVEQEIQKDVGQLLTITEDVLHVFLQSSFFQCSCQLVGEMGGAYITT